MVRDMATQSFFEDLILDTPEAVANMEKAFEKYEKEGGYKVRNQLKLCTDRTIIEHFMDNKRTDYRYDKTSNPNNYLSQLK